MTTSFFNIEVKILEFILAKGRFVRKYEFDFDIANLSFQRVGRVREAGSAIPPPAELYSIVYVLWTIVVGVVFGVVFKAVPDRGTKRTTTVCGLSNASQRRMPPPPQRRLAP